MEVGATYHDGETARPRKVVLRADRVNARLAILDAGSGDTLDTWSFDDIRELRDHGLHRALVAHLPGHEARVVVEGATVISDFRAMVPGIGRHYVDPRAVRRVLWWAGGAVVSLVLLLFVIIPALADRMALWLPPESEQAFGRAVIRQASMLFAYSDNDPFCRDEEIDAAFAALTARLAPEGVLPYPITVQVIDSDTVNAFAAPGGQIVILRGLLDEAGSGEEVAAVLAHEIGHVVARDPTRIAMRAVGSAGLLGLALGDVTGGAAISIVTEELMRASYTREAETAADAFAHRALASGGLPPGALGDFFERLRDAGDEDSPMLQAFMSHPMMAERISAARTAQTDLSGPPAFDARLWARMGEVCD